MDDLKHDEDKPPFFIVRWYRWSRNFLESKFKLIPGLEWVRSKSPSLAWAIILFLWIVVPFGIVIAVGAGTLQASLFRTFK